MSDPVQPIEFKPTEQGFVRGEFVDLYGQKCSVQESSLATDSALWLGVEVDLEGREVFKRMHLTQAMAAALIPVLQEFAATGEIGGPRFR